VEHQIVTAAAQDGAAGEYRETERGRLFAARGEKRVAGLLEAAAAIFAEVGFEAATMRDIAERAGASIGSLYQFYRNKDVVARAIKTQYCQEVKAVSITRSAGTGGSKLVFSEPS
jgi:AcrR family transcriptional regulator